MRHFLAIGELTVRRRSGLDRQHADCARSIIADLEAVAIGAHRQRFGMVTDVDGIGHALGNGVDDRHTAITEVAGVGKLAVAAGRCFKTATLRQIRANAEACSTSG
jgi:hypothetical protein